MALRKEALQYLAIALENGALPNPRQRAEILSLMTEAMQGDDWLDRASTRLWTYILACHLREALAAQPLWEAASKEVAPHLTVWACAAVCLSTPPSVPFYQERAGSPTLTDLALLRRQAINRGSQIDESFGLAVSILGSAAHPILDVQSAIASSTINSNYARWLLLGLGRNEIRFLSNQERLKLVEFVSGDCISHTDDQVAEYGFWALYRQSRNGILSPETTSNVVSWNHGNVRRWAYRALANTTKSKSANIEFLIGQVSQEGDHAVARYGLATSIVGKPGKDYDDYDYSLLRRHKNLLLDWHSREQNSLIIARLTDYLVSVSEKDGNVRSYLSEMIDGEGSRELIETIKRRARRAPQLAKLVRNNDISTTFLPLLEDAGESVRIFVSNSGVMQMTRDTYTAGQVGAMGPGAHAHDMTLQQVQNLGAELDIGKLTSELERLRTAMKTDSKLLEHDEAVGHVAAAERAAAKNDVSGVLGHLKAAGNWTLDVATKIGTTVAAEAIKRALLT